MALSDGHYVEIMTPNRPKEWTSISVAASTSAEGMRVAYFTNVYPAVSHTFIRREIRAIEALGVKVFRYALVPDEVVDAEDMREKTNRIYSCNWHSWVDSLLPQNVYNPAHCDGPSNFGRSPDRLALRSRAFAASCLRCGSDGAGGLVQTRRCAAYPRTLWNQPGDSCYVRSANFRNPLQFHSSWS